MSHFVCRVLPASLILVDRLILSSLMKSVLRAARKHERTTSYQVLAVPVQDPRRLEINRQPASLRQVSLAGSTGLLDKSQSPTCYVRCMFQWKTDWSFFSTSKKQLHFGGSQIHLLTRESWLSLLAADQLTDVTLRQCTP